MDEYTEWRVVAKVPDRGSRLDTIIAEVRATTGPDVDIHRRGWREILIYAFTEEEIRDAHRELTKLLARDAIPAETTFTRWNPGKERWQEPSLPVEPPRRPLPPAWVDLGELGYELRIRLQSVEERRRLEALLQDEGRPTFTDGWKRLVVGAVDEKEAEKLADDLRLKAPLAQMNVRPLTRFRRWLIRRSDAGDYGSGDLGGVDSGGFDGGL